MLGLYVINQYRPTLSLSSSVIIMLEIFNYTTIYQSKAVVNAKMTSSKQPKFSTC
jgi:hypothetical protein